MIKLFLILITLIFFASCKKCITCKAFNRRDNTVMSQEDYCGPGKYVDESKKSYIYIWNDTETFAECK